MTEAHESSEGGSRIYRHEKRVPSELTGGDERVIGGVSDHIEKHIGKVAWVFHELISDLVHIDVHVVEPTDDRPFYTLVTSGMSEAPMRVENPDGSTSMAYAELMVCLPKDWPVSQEAFSDERNYWPVRWLKILARLPHEYDTFLGSGHTIPNGEPAEPLADDTQLMGFIVLPAISLPTEAWTLRLSPEVEVEFFAIYPLHQDEMDLKLREGTDALIALFEKHQIRDVVDPHRPNMVGSSGTTSPGTAGGKKRWWWPF